MIENYGHIPNGNRTLLLSEPPQPPVFALMVELFEEDGAGAALPDHLKMGIRLRMDGADPLARSTVPSPRCVDDALPNRYWGDRDTPRDESPAKDVETAVFWSSAQ